MLPTTGVVLNDRLIDPQVGPCRLAEHEIAARLIVLVLDQELSTEGILLEAGFRDEAHGLVVLAHQRLDVAEVHQDFTSEYQRLHREHQRSYLFPNG